MERSDNAVSCGRNHYKIEQTALHLGPDPLPSMFHRLLGEIAEQKKIQDGEHKLRAKAPSGHPRVSAGPRVPRKVCGAAAG